MLTDAGGNFVNAFAYDAFGTLIASNGVPQTAYLYAGEQWDPDLEMYSLRARYFNPNTGRFWTMDTFGGNNEDPLSLHKYLYCHDNPVMRVDPSGHEDLVSVLAAVSITACLVSLSGDAVTPQRATGRSQPKDLGTSLLTDQDLNYWMHDTYDRLQKKSRLWSLYVLDEATFEVGGVASAPYWTGRKLEMHWKYVGTDPSIPKVSRGNEVNYFGIGMYEAWSGESLWSAYFAMYEWKRIAYWTTPNGNEKFWMRYGYNGYFDIQKGLR